MCVDSLSVGAVRLIKDLNGNHVIQKCLSKLEPHLNQVRLLSFDSINVLIFFSLCLMQSRPIVSKLLHIVMDVVFYRDVLIMQLRPRNCNLFKK